MTKEEKIEKIISSFRLIVEKMSDTDLEAYYQAAEVLEELERFIPDGEPN